jgi:hypothetical protein
MNVVIDLKDKERESLLDEISDMNTENVMKFYPLIHNMLGIIKDAVIRSLKGE